MMRKTVVTIATMAMLAGVPAGARAQAPPAPPGGAAAKPPADWWDHSSLSPEVSNANWLSHVDGSVGAMWADGNTDGYSVDTASSLVTRKRRWTNRFDVSSARRSMTYGLGGGNANVSQHTLRNRLEYDLTPHALVLVGFEYYKDNLVFIDDRATYYAGAGTALVDTPHQHFNVLGGVGHVRFDFDVEAMSLINPIAVRNLPTDTPHSEGVMGLEAWHYTFSNHVTVSEDASGTKYVNSDLGHEWTFGASLTVPVSQRVSLVPAFRAREEANIYIEALHVRELDRSFNIGVKVSF